MSIVNNVPSNYMYCNYDNELDRTDGWTQQDIRYIYIYVEKLKTTITFYKQIFFFHIMSQDSEIFDGV